MSRLCIYHKGCRDGFTAAWIVRQYWGEVSGAEYLAAHYGEDAPDVTGRDVLIVDFSYPREVLERMHRQAAKLRVLDHHKTAKEALEGLDYCVFDMDRSGAGLAWDELIGGPRPWLVNYVEDRDLWRHALWASKRVNAYIRTYEFDFDAWDLLAKIGPETAAAGGKVVLRTIDQYVAYMREHARVAEFAGHAVPVVNACGMHASELVGSLAEGQPFAVAWFLRGDGRFQYMLRSRNPGGVDVGAIAKEFGGGGHVHAAGFDSPGRVA